MLSALAYGYIFPIYLNMINLPLGVSLLYLGATFAIFYVLLSAMSDFSKNTHANFFPSFAGAALQAFKLTASPGLVYSFYAYFSSVSAFFLSLTLALQVAAAAASILLVWGLLSHLETLVKSAVDFKKTSQSSAKAGFHPRLEPVVHTNIIGSGPIPGTSDGNDLKDRSGGDQPGEKMKNAISDVNSSPFSGSYSTSLSPSASPESSKINAQQLPLDTSIGSSPSIHSSMNLTPGDIQIAGGKAESKLDPNRSQGEINDLIEWANTQVVSLSDGSLKSVEQENIKKLKSALDSNPGITDNMDLRDFIEIFSQLFDFDSGLDQLDENGINERISQFKSWCESIQRNQQTYATFINRVNLDLIHRFVSCQQNELKTHGDEIAEIQVFKNYTPQDFWDNLRDLLVGERDLSHLQCAVSLECVKYCAENLNQEAVKSPNTFQASSYLNDKTKSFLLPCASKFLHLGMLDESDLSKFPFDFCKSVRERCKFAAQAEQRLFGDKILNPSIKEKVALLSSQFNSPDEVSPFADEILGVELANISSQINQGDVRSYFKLLKKLNHYSDGMLDEFKRLGISIRKLIIIHFCNGDSELFESLPLYRVLNERFKQYSMALSTQIMNDWQAATKEDEQLANWLTVEGLFQIYSLGNHRASDALLGKLYGRIYSYDFIDFRLCKDSLERAKVHLMAAKMGFISDQIGQLLNNSESLFSNKNPSDLQRFAQFLNVLLDDNQPGDDPICTQWNDSSQSGATLKERVSLLKISLELKLATLTAPTEPTVSNGASSDYESTGVDPKVQKLLNLISAVPVHHPNGPSSSSMTSSSALSCCTQNGPDRSDDKLWAALKQCEAPVHTAVLNKFLHGQMAIPHMLLRYVENSSSFSIGEKSRVQQWYENKLMAPQDTLPQSYGKENIFSR
jgi:hypothetical protein